MSRTKISKTLFSVIFLLLVIFPNVSPERKQKISDVNVLLPLCASKPCSSVSYRISAYAGCYEWSLDRPFPSLTITPIPDQDLGCHSSVIISTKTESLENRDFVWLIARDRKSNEEFKCKVGFNNVKILTIAKRFDHMNVGEIVELNAIGFDEFNNTFSSLEGFKFNWKMIQDKGEGVPPGQILKLKEEKREASEIRLKIEEEYFSDIVLLRGIRTGKVEISVELKENGYEKVDSKPMNLYVVEHFNIVPEEIYLHKGIPYRFRINIQSKGNVDYSQYLWSLPTSDCGSVDSNGNYLSEEICDTVVTASDKRIDNFNQAKAKIHNVVPTKLDVGIHEIENFDKNSFKLEKYDKSPSAFSFLSQWELVVDKYYVIKNFLFYETNPINDENTQIKYYIGNGEFHKHFEEIACNQEKKFCVVRAKIVSNQNFEINAEMEGKKFPVKKFVKIFSKIEISKYGQSKFILPYLGFTGASSEDYTLRSQELKLNVKGGTGRYMYYSANTNIVNIKNEIIYGQYVGSTTVRVVDARNPTNFDQIEVVVDEIYDLNFVEERQEIEKNSNFEIMVNAVNKHGEKFTNCSSTPIFHQSDFTNEEILSIAHGENFNAISEFVAKNMDLFYKKYSSRLDIEYLKYANYGICNAQRFRTSFEGIRKLKFYARLFSEKATSQDSRIYSSRYAQVNVFDKLYILSPTFTDQFTRKLLNKGFDKNIANTFVITKDTQIDFKLSGGVARWQEEVADYNEIVEFRDVNPLSAKTENFVAANKKIEYIKTNTDKNLIFKCKENDVKNDAEIKIVIRNRESPTLLRPKTSEITFTVVCTFPHSLSIFLLDDSINSADKHDSRYVDIFSVEQKRNIEYYIRKQAIERFRVYAFDSYNRMFFNITNLKGEWELEYDRHNLSENQINRMKQLIVGKSKIYNSPEFVHRKIKFSDFNAKFTLLYRMGKSLTQQILINLLDFPSIEPENSTLYLTENNFIHLNIRNGSGDFDVSYSDYDLADADYLRSERMIKLYPRRKGILQVSVRDKKLSNVITKGNVFISRISAIQLIGGGLMQIHSEKKLTLKVFDEFKNVFSSDQIPKMKLIIEASGNTKGGIQFNLNNGVIDTSEIVARGLFSDDYYIRIVDPYSRIASNTVKLVVFDKLEIFPQYLLMLPGSTYMLNIRGGPREFINIVRKYTIGDSSIASVKENEPEVTALALGETTLKVALEMKTSEDDPNKDSVLCTEEIQVIVAIPDGLEIYNAFNRKIYIKSNIRLLAMLKLGNKVFSVGNSKIDYYWNIDPPTNAQLATTNLVHLKECENNGQNGQNKDTCSAKEKSISNNIGIFLSAINKGDVEVKLKVFIHYPEEYNRKQSTFEKKEKLIIEEKLDMDVPEFNGEKGHPTMYLVPPEVEHDLKTNKDPNVSL